MPRLEGQRVLEFGCNVGASSIVLASLGAEVVGVDINANLAALARLHASAYGLGHKVDVLHLDDSAQMPLPERDFNLIVCNSVLEYVAPTALTAIQKELLRVLAPGGLILVLATSNRLWPREVHSGKLLYNYLPRSTDGLFSGGRRQRGLSPFTVRGGFAECALVDNQDGCSAYLSARRRMGTKPWILSAIRGVAPVLRPFGVTVSMLTPSFAMALRRKAALRSG